MKTTKKNIFTHKTISYFEAIVKANRPYQSLPACRRLLFPLFSACNKVGKEETSARRQYQS